MDGSPRTAVLVVADRSGAVVGVSDPRPVDSPWWPETQSLLDTFVDVLDERAMIVRLLAAERAETAEAGWVVTYLAQRGSDRTTSDAPLHPIDEAAVAGWLDSRNDLRMPWAELGGPSADLGWASAELAALGYEVSGVPRQHKTWNLSSVWEMPLGAEAAWLKTTAPFGRHEAAVLRLLAGHRVPRLLADDGHRQLLEAMPGRDGFGATVAEQLPIVDALVDLQLASVDMVDDAIAAAVPDRRRPALTAELRGLLDRLLPEFDATSGRLTVEEAESIGHLNDDIDARLAALDECGLPTVIVHGDAHPGNARVGVDPVIFDWSDAFVGNPIWDLRRVLSGGDNARRRVREHWLQRWADAVPGSDPWRAAEVSAPLSPLLAASTYQCFVDGIEPSERIYHRDDVWSELRLAATAVTLPGRSPEAETP